MSYDYSKAADPLQPWSSHITSLLVRQTPPTSDITLSTATEDFRLHKFLLSARSPYFMRKFADAPETVLYRLSHAVPVEAFRIVLRYLYLGDLPRDFVGPQSTVTEEEVFKGIDKLCKQLEIEQLWEAVLSINDRRLARQRQQDEVQRAQRQVDSFFQNTVLKHKMVVDTSKVGDVKWPHHNAIFANCILRADEPSEDDDEHTDTTTEPAYSGTNIPVGPAETISSSSGTNGTATSARRPRRSVLFPAHKAFLIRSPYFETMFSSDFLEAHDAEHLHIIQVDCTPPVLEIVLRFLYTEKADCPLEHALDLLYTSDMLLLDKLKTKAAVTISTLGSGTSNALVDRTHNSFNDPGNTTNNNRPSRTPTASPGTEEQEGIQKATEAEAEADGAVEVDVEPINVYDVIRAAWDLRVQRLEEFAARYLAGRLEDYIDEDEFAELIRESAARIRERQETDTIELLDDIRYYLSERFRLRFEGDGLEEMLDEEGEGGFAVDDGGGGEPGGDGRGDEVKQDGGGGGGGEGEKRVRGVRTLNGEVVEDEFASDAVNYQILLGKIDKMLERLNLEA